MIAKFMPILDGEEEEEEFEEEEEEDQNEKSEIITHQTPDNSNENDMNKIVLQNEQKLKQVKHELSQIENQIKFVKNKLNLPDLNSTDLQEGDVIETPIELKDDSTVSNFNNQLKVLNDQINQIGNILNISPTDEKLSPDHQAKDEKNANQNDSTIPKNDNEEPFQTNATNHIPIFFGKSKCLLCGTSNCHICNKCKKPYCFICSKTDVHEKTH
ncbi:hypothetical protein TRFO_06095 [Tritrichomonas foetus]|uniref:Uncharacterized protein n=1 Tax=Tritrichomonas foetus TaxID=1144522 RepID=A0A1J4K5X6_9EUKA|nr:hypothetical protein TRFO_06095 [Tritrichomonas foetus]|eukprot:OHT05086.1 hypothetical protein TRFO_06095 [Tritrichomonas foetus]